MRLRSRGPSRRRLTRTGRSARPADHRRLRGQREVLGHRRPPDRRIEVASEQGCGRARVPESRVGPVERYTACPAAVNEATPFKIREVVPGRVEGAQARQPGQVPPGPGVLGAQERHVERGVVAHHRMSGQSLVQVGDEVGEHRRVGHIVIPDPVDVCRTHRSLRVDPGAPVVEHLSGRRGVDQRQLEDAVGPRRQPGGLHIQYDVTGLRVRPERARPRPQRSQRSPARGPLMLFMRVHRRHRYRRRGQNSGAPVLPQRARGPLTSVKWPAHRFPRVFSTMPSTRGIADIPDRAAIKSYGFPRTADTLEQCAGRKGVRPWSRH